MSSPKTGPAEENEFSARYRLNIIVMLAACQAIAYLDRVNMSVATPVLIENYHYSPATAGLLLSMFNWAYLVAVLFAGPFVDWVRSRVAYPLGIIMWSLATALCGITVRFTPLAFFRAFVGIGESVMIPAGQRIIFETFQKEQRASAVGTFFAGNKVGLAAGIPVSAMLYHWLGLPWIFYVAGAIGFVWLLWFLAIYHSAGQTSNATVPGAAQRKIRWAALLRCRTTWGVILGQFGYGYMYFFFVSWLPGYLVLQRHMSVLKGGFVGMLTFLVGVPMTIVGGSISDRLIKQGMRTTPARKIIVVCGLCLATVFTILGAYTNSAVLAITFLTIAVGCFSLATGPANAMSVDVAPRPIVASLVSLQLSGGNVGGALAPLVTGVLVSRTGSFQLALVVTAVMALVFGCGGFGLLVGNLDEGVAPGPARRLQLGSRPPAISTSA